MVKPAQSICASCATLRNFCSKVSSHSNLENGRRWWRRHIGAGYGRCLEVNIFCAECGSNSPSTGRCKEDSSGRCSRKTRWKARSVTTRVSLQRGPGTSQKKCGYRLRSPDNAPCQCRNEAWQLGYFFRENAGRTESPVNGPLIGVGKCMRR